MEIVTEPDFTSGTDARAFVKELILILTLLETCRCKMEGIYLVAASPHL